MKGKNQTSKSPVKQKETKPKQLSLGLSSPFVNIFYSVKTRITARLNLFEANRFINDGLIWFYATLQATGAFFQLIFILNRIETLPSIIPLFGYTQLSNFALLPKYYILIFPLLAFVIFTYSFKAARTNYFRNTLLSHYILFLATLIVIFLSIHVISVVSNYV
ncbi:hypothetical protein IT417_00625 [bacterium]|nr:hypothetical protein [bacterium]